MMDYANDALYGDSQTNGTLPPSVFNPNATTFADVMVAGIMGAAAGVLNRPQQQAVTVPYDGGVQVNASNGLINALLLGGLIYWAMG